MADKKTNAIGIILVVFITLVLGLVLLQQIGTTVQSVSQIDSKTNETIAITGGSGVVSGNKVTGLSFFGNATHSTEDTNLTIGTNVNFSRNGSIRVITGYNITNRNTEEGGIGFANGNYNVSYTNEGSNYVADSTSKTIINLIPLFFVLAIIFIGYLLVKYFAADFF